MTSDSAPINLLSTVDDGLAALQSLQAKYDQAMWDVDEPAFSKLRHIHVHLSITTGKLARALEPLDHRAYHGEPVPVSELADELRPVLADLLMHAAQLANELHIELAEALRSRYRHNAARFAPESSFAAV